MVAVNLSHDELFAVTQLLANRHSIEAFLTGSGLSPLGKKVLRDTLKNLGKRLIVELQENFSTTNRGLGD